MSLTKMHDDPYAAGWAAHERGEKLDSNPRALGSDARRLWRMGWLEAEKMAEARRRTA